MKAKLIVEGKEFEIEILDEELQKIVATSVSNGYERSDVQQRYWFATEDGEYAWESEDGTSVDDKLYCTANYYSSEDVVANNTRADILMRRLRRFAVEHRKCKLDWNDEWQEKWSIFYDSKIHNLEPWDSYTSREFNSIYFDSKETAALAIVTFRDELMWYFTEYKDSL